MKEEEKIPQSIFEKKLLLLLEENGPLSRNEISKLMNIPRTTVYDKIMKAMQERNVKILKTSEPQHKRGRPKVLYSIIQ